jgi:hypothetical protein
MLSTCALGVSAQDDTHSRNAPPDYARVFNQDRVGQLDLRIAASDWQALIADMQEMAGQSGGQLGGGNPPGGGAGGPGGGFPAPSADAVAACSGRIEGDACSFGTPPVIQKAFERYYRTTVLSGTTDPNKLHDLKADLDGYQVYAVEQVEAATLAAQVATMSSCCLETRSMCQPM